MADDSTLSVRAARADERASVPILYLALEGARPTAPSTRHVLTDVERVAIGRGHDRTATRSGGELVLTVPDPRMSGRHATLVRELGRWVIVDGGSKNGTFVDGDAVQRAVVHDGVPIELGTTIFTLRHHDLPAGERAESVECGSTAPAFATVVPELARDLADLAKVAASGVAILIGGDTGTGKELIARAVHAASRRTGALVAVNCAAIPAALVEAELFGVRRGAFSGAVEDRPGLVRRADGGTLFLDEVGDLAPSAQAALLRVLAEREVVAVGDTRAIPVDFRVVAATLHDLDARVAEGTFRGDLLARLAGFRIVLPALRDRLEDVGTLVGALLHRLGATDHQLALDAVRAIVRHGWPRNVRELEKALESAIALAPATTIELAHLPPALRAPAHPPEHAAHRAELIALLERHHGNVSAIARELGKARMQIQRWLARYRIDPDRYRT